MEGDVRLDDAQASAIIRSQFPELGSATVRYLGEGCDSCAFEVNGEWVFRFPKRADVAQQIAIEARMLPLLAARSPLRLPVFSFRGEPCARYRYQFAGYRKLPGIPAIHLDQHALAPIDCAPALGRFLSWLHRFPAREAEAHGVEPREIAELIDEVRADALDEFDRLHDALASAPLDEWRAFLEAGCPAPARRSLPSVLVHGDLASEHVLYDPECREVTGIIDWSDMALGDPAIDLAAFYHWGGRACLAAALSAYDGPVDEGMVARARFLAACRGVADVVFGLEMGRREYIAAGVRALTLCQDGPDVPCP